MKKHITILAILAFCLIFPVSIIAGEEYLVLIGSEHPITEEYSAICEGDLVEISHTRDDGRPNQKMRLEAAKALDAMLDAAASEGCVGLSVTSAYRSRAYQRELFNASRDRYLARGIPFRDAVRMTRRYLAAPGESEHESGLAADLHNLPMASLAFADTPEYRWLCENAHHFGFILRYPEGKEKLTGIAFEPWHYRYVGKTSAKAIYERGLCLEEYLSKKS